MSSTRLEDGSDVDWERLDALVGAYLELVRERRAPTPEAFAAAHPELAGRLEVAVRGALAMSGIVPDAPAAAGLAPGARLGDFVLERELGRGGMGVVWLARQESLGRAVAVKVLPPMSRHSRERFRREARAAARLSHPHLVAVFGSGEEASGVCWYAMQHVDGAGLDAVLAVLRERRGGHPVPVSSAAELATLLSGSRLERGDRAESSATRARPAPRWENAARIVLQAAEALSYAHARGVMHRDVKPANLLLDRDGQVLVADFGLCKLAGSDTLSRTGEVIGTLRYMAPEQFRGESDVRGDVYSLGLVLHELLTLQPAFDASSRGELVRDLMHAAPTRPCRVDPAIPRDLETIVLKASAKLPEERYGTAEAMAEDLRRFLSGRPIVARAPGALYLARLALRRNRALAWTVLVATLVLVAASLAYVSSLRRTNRALEERTGELQHQVYVAGVQAASAALLARDVGSAHRALESLPAEQRGWEWAHLRAVADQSLGRIFDTGALVTTVAWSKDGRRLLVSSGAVARLLDESGHELHRELSALPSEIAKAALSGDARHMVFVSVAGEVRSVDLEDPERTVSRTLSSLLGSVALSPDGARVAVGQYDGSIAILPLDLSGEPEWLRGHTAQVDDMAFAPDGAHLVSGSWDGTARVWALASGRATAVLGPHNGWVRAVAWSPDGARIATGSVAGEVRAWDARDGRLLAQFRPHAAGVRGLAFSPDGRQLASGSDDRLVRIHDVESGALLRTLLGSENAVVDLAYRPDGERLVSGSQSGAVLLWDPDVSGGRVDLLGHLTDASAPRFSADGERVAVGGRDGTLRIWDAETGTPWRALVGANGAVLACAFDASGRTVLASTWVGWLHAWDAEAGRVAWAVDVGALASSIAWNEARAGWTVVLVDGTLLTLAREDGRELARGAEPVAAFACAAIAPDAPLVATGSSKGEIRLWDARTLEPLRRWSAGTQPVTSLAFHPGGTELESVSDRILLRRWSLSPAPHESAPAVRACAPDAIGERVSGEAVSADGTRLATWNAEGSIQLWDARSREQLLQIHGHQTVVAGVDFDPRGRWMVSAGSDSHVVVWGRETSRELSERLRSPEVAARRVAAAAQAELGSPAGLTRRVRELLRAPDGTADAYSEAFAHAEGLYRSDRLDPRYRAFVGETMWRQGRRDAARNRLDEALVLGGGLDWAEADDLAFLALVRAWQGDRDGARDALERARVAPGADACADLLAEAQAAVEAPER